jgi:hypothetical protein
MPAYSIIIISGSRLKKSFLLHCIKLCGETTAHPETKAQSLLRSRPVACLLLSIVACSYVSWTKGVVDRRSFKLCLRQLVKVD